MKSSGLIAAVLVLTLTLALASGAMASLIGDEVVLQYYRSGTLEDEATQTVASGPDDAVTLGEFTLDMEADRLEIVISEFNIFPSTSLLWGLRILGMNDQTNPDWLLLGVDVETTLGGWDDSRLEFFNDSAGGNVQMNFQGMRLSTGETLTAIFEFGPNPIPIPATAALFLTGLVGFALVRRKIRP